MKEICEESLKSKKKTQIESICDFETPKKTSIHDLLPPQIVDLKREGRKRAERETQSEKERESEQ